MKAIKTILNTNRLTIRKLLVIVLVVSIPCGILLTSYYTHEEQGEYSINIDVITLVNKVRRCLDRRSVVMIDVNKKIMILIEKVDYSTKYNIIEHWVTETLSLYCECNYLLIFMNKEPYAIADYNWWSLRETRYDRHNQVVLLKPVISWYVLYFLKNHVMLLQETTLS